MHITRIRQRYKLASVYFVSSTWAYHDPEARQHADAVQWKQRIARLRCVAGRRSRRLGRRAVLDARMSHRTALWSCFAHSSALEIKHIGCMYAHLQWQTLAADLAVKHSKQCIKPSFGRLE